MKLTKRHNNSVCWNGNPDLSTQARYRELLDRLAEYENITDGISLDRLRENCDAEREERCWITPCKPGDSAYFLIKEIDDTWYVSEPHRITENCRTR